MIVTSGYERKEREQQTVQEKTKLEEVAWRPNIYQQKSKADVHREEVNSRDVDKEMTQE